MTHYQEFEDKLMYMCTQTRFYDEDDSSLDDEIIHVTQNLAPEQYQYEFPTKTCLKALEYLDEQEDEYSFFDESSFTTFSSTTTAITALSSVYKQQTSDYSPSHMDQWQNHETNHQLVEDGRLSPLELPAQETDRPCESTSCETITRSSTKAVGPSSFLSDLKRDHMYKHVTQTRANNNNNNLTYIHKDVFMDDEEELSVFCNESVPVMDTDVDSSTDSSIRTSESRIVLIRLNKYKQFPTMSIVQRCPTSLTYLQSDEGYADDEDEGQELESYCKFYPITVEEQQECLEQSKRDQAAIKIQSLWRGYRSRLCDNKSPLRADQRVVINLASLCNRFHRRQMNCVNDRLAQLEQRVQEETAMRMAFEKAMEDMTVLIDQQQKILYDRLEQEVHMRQLYENKMNAALNQLQPLENRLKKEVAARNKLEDVMTRVQDQMHETDAARQQQLTEDAESKRLMQLKLDQALEDISIIKKQQQQSSRPPRPTTAPVAQPLKRITGSTRTNNNSLTTSAKNNNDFVRKSIVPTTSSLNTRPTSRLTSVNKQAHLIERPSVIPSNRRPVLGTSINKRATNNSTNNSSTTTTATTPRRALLTRK